MSAFEVVRYASQEELQRWRTSRLPARHQRYIGKAHSNPTVNRDAQMVGKVAQSPEPIRPIIGTRQADDTLDRLIQRRLEALQRIGRADPVALRQMVQHIRRANPGLLGRMSDDDAMRRLHELATEEQKLVVQRVYNKNRFWGPKSDIAEVLNGNAGNTDG